MLILVINCGSSSVKYQLFEIAKRTNECLAKGLIERIGTGTTRSVHQRGSAGASKRNVRCRDHYDAIRIVVDTLTDAALGVVRDLGRIDGVGHRVVHGAEEFSGSVVITARVLRSIEKYSELAPLHNPLSVMGIRSCMKYLSHAPQVAVFDTSFHQTMPPHAYVYGLPYHFYKKYGIRRYGFHGTSHRYVSQKASEILKKPAGRLKMVTCHLGNGCSMTAVDRGKSVDTSMGFTPLEGLLMGTRPGDFDPAVIMYILGRTRCSHKRLSEILNKESGLLGVSGISNDMRDLTTAAEEGNARAQLALDIFSYRIKKYVGAYAAAMNGLDAVVFTAGIGENWPRLVNTISADLKSVFGSKVSFLVVPTNEELMIAKDTFRIVRNEQKKNNRGSYAASKKKTFKNETR